MGSCVVVWAGGRTFYTSGKKPRGTPSAAAAANPGLRRKSSREAGAEAEPGANTESSISPSLPERSGAIGLPAATERGLGKGGVWMCPCPSVVAVGFLPRSREL